MFAHVLFNAPMPEPYTYAVPEALYGTLAPGMLVEAPLGTRTAVGCVVAMAPDAGTVDPARLRPLTRRVTPDYRIDPEIVALARFVSDYYFAGPGEALATASVVGFRDVRRHRSDFFRLVADWRALLDAPLTARQQQACETLEEAGFPVLPRAHLATAAHASPAILRRLEQLGLVVPTDPDPEPVVESHANDFADPLVPSDEQRDARAVILEALEPTRFQVHLLHGVTGSGKTEVYLQAIEHVLRAGGTALCLLPEIALTPQTVERFQHRFRQEIGVFHSQLTRRQKLELYCRIQAGAVRLVIGARSAVFAPLPRLGIIIIDEEHDGSYKQGENPRYHARDVAIVRARRLGIPVVLGSATPSMESLHNARTGKYHLLRLSSRPSGSRMPDVRVIDMATQVVPAAAPSLLSEDMVAAITQRLAAGEQSLLFLNRRGFSNFLFCPSCKWVARCDEDDVALTVHRKRPRGESPEEPQIDLFRLTEQPDDFVLRCHFCGSRREAPRVCPECKADGLLTVGAGTQRIEEELAARFPTARLLRLDQDTAGGREKFLVAWSRMISGDADIIFGTQMIAKGLHLERVTLVGVVLADVGLFLPDFRAEERTFQLLTQVAGRSGRVSDGEVLFQTYLPNHTAIRHAMMHDTEGFFEAELARRAKLGFPPFSRMIAITLADKDRDRAWGAARQMGFLLGRMRPRHGASRVTVNGPTIAPIARLAGRFRYRILLRSESPKALGILLRAVLDHADWKPTPTLHLTIDVDPIDLL
ncbi:MAG: primosomal protein N' [Candidatus Sumerlaeia bacterium]|nr:primosomal protein N' [Candidatus Sumerlaeia bacterium]